MIDGRPAKEGRPTSPRGKLDDWLVTDERGEPMPELRRLARPRGLAPGVRPFRRSGLRVEPRPLE
jgi:hypothetical protein